MQCEDALAATRPKLTYRDGARRAACRDRVPGRDRGTGSYDAGLARHAAAAGIRVVEVDRSDRQDGRRQGKSDPLDAVSAAECQPGGRGG
jgi:hypothetical protein